MSIVLRALWALTEIVTDVVTDHEQSSDGPIITHYYCCDPNRALCGEDVAGSPMSESSDDDDEMCVVCLDLKWTRCELTCEAQDDPNDPWPGHDVQAGNC